jgi:hypothetical protein
MIMAGHTIRSNILATSAASPGVVIKMSFLDLLNQEESFEDRFALVEFLVKAVSVLTVLVKRLCLDRFLDPTPLSDLLSELEIIFLICNRTSSCKSSMSPTLREISGRAAWAAFGPNPRIVK